MNARLSGLLAVLGLWTLLALPAPALAQTQTSFPNGGIPIVLGPASVQAKGKIVSVPVTFTCVLDADYDVDMTLHSGENEFRGRESGSCRPGETVTETIWFSAGNVPLFTWNIARVGLMVQQSTVTEWVGTYVYEEFPLNNSAPVSYDE